MNKLAHKVLQGLLWAAAAGLMTAMSACDFATDAAARIANDLQTGAGLLGKEAGARYTLKHAVPSKAGECTGPYTVQFDKVGLLVVWCKDANGVTVSSHSTSYHRNFADTAETFILDKPAAAPLIIELQRRDGRPVITKVS